MRSAIVQLSEEVEWVGVFLSIRLEWLLDKVVHEPVQRWNHRMKHLGQPRELTEWDEHQALTREWAESGVRMIHPKQTVIHTYEATEQENLKRSVR